MSLSRQFPITDYQTPWVWMAHEATTYCNYYNHFSAVWIFLGQPRRDIHPLTPIMVINHPLFASSIYYDPRHPRCSIYVPGSLYPQSLSKFSLVYLLAWHPPLHTPYMSSSNHCLLFTADAHTIATCFAVLPRLCHLILVSCSHYIINCKVTSPLAPLPMCEINLSSKSMASL